MRALPFHTIDEVFQEVESGAADFGVVPIENSTEGSVNKTDSRLVALEVLEAVERGAFADAVLGNRLEESDLEGADRARAVEAVDGVA